MNNNYIGVDLDLFRQPKIQRLELKHGKGAVAVYLQVYLKLAELGGKANIEDLALWEREFFIKKETLEEVIFFPDLFTIKDNFLHCNLLNAKLNRIKNKSEKARASANARWSKISETSTTSSNTDAMRTQNERNTNKEKKIKEKESKINKNILDQEKEILDFWNSKQITIHKSETKILNAISKILDEKSLDEIKKGIEIYSEVYHSKNTWFSYKWTLLEFLTRKNGLEVFMYKELKDYLNSPKSSNFSNEMSITGDIERPANYVDLKKKDEEVKNNEIF